MACQPKFTNHARDQAALDKRFSVNVTMRGVIAAFMPIDFDGKPPGSEGRQAIYSVPVADRVSICANKVREGHASLILWERTELASWLYDHRHPERCRDWEFSPGVQMAKSNPAQTFLAVNKSVGWPLFSAVQHCLAWLRQSSPVEVTEAIAERELKRGASCPTPMTQVYPTINFKDQEGLFVVFGSCVGIAVLISLSEAYMLQRKKRASANEARAATKIQRIVRGKAGRTFSNDIKRGPVARGRADLKSRGVMTDTELLRELLSDFGSFESGLARVENLVESLAAPSLASTSGWSSGAAAHPTSKGTEVRSETTRFRMHGSSRPGARQMPRLALRRRAVAMAPMRLRAVQYGFRPGLVVDKSSSL